MDISALQGADEEQAAATVIAGVIGNLLADRCGGRKTRIHGSTVHIEVIDIVNRAVLNQTIGAEQRDTIARAISQRAVAQGVIPSGLSI